MKVIGIKCIIIKQACFLGSLIDTIVGVCVGAKKEELANFLGNRTW